MSKKGPRTPNPVVEAREATGISKCLHIRPPCYERALTGKEASLVCKRIMRKQVFLWKNNEQCPTLYPHSSLFSLKLETQKPTKLKLSPENVRQRSVVRRKSTRAGATTAVFCVLSRNGGSPVTDCPWTVSLIVAATHNHQKESEKNLYLS
ncbi:hypothetical protein ACFE04_019569 [Oxalis oulophora]